MPSILNSPTKKRRRSKLPKVTEAAYDGVRSAPVQIRKHKQDRDQKEGCTHTSQEVEDESKSSPYEVIHPGKCLYIGGQVFAQVMPTDHEMDDEGLYISLPVNRSGKDDPPHELTNISAIGTMNTEAMTAEEAADMEIPEPQPLSRSKSMYNHAQ